jgi:hypothetical protein
LFLLHASNIDSEQPTIPYVLTDPLPNYEPSADPTSEPAYYSDNDESLFDTVVALIQGIDEIDEGIEKDKLEDADQLIETYDANAGIGIHADTEPPLLMRLYFRSRMLIFIRL